MDSLRESGRSEFKTLLICGGLAKNPLYVEAHAEACNLPILVPEEEEVVLVGAAILGACGAKAYADLGEACR